MSQGAEATNLAIALSTAPNLRTVISRLPTVPNDIFFTISKNPTLRCLHFVGASASLANGFMRNAMEDDRLAQLIDAGSAESHRCR